jgi:hypothetical protein
LKMSKRAPMGTFLNFFDTILLKNYFSMVINAKSKFY